jgi:hydrogenase expression/formation protein HypE
MKDEENPNFQCPVPIHQYPAVMMAHGGGGKLTNQLIESVFLPVFGNPSLEARHDGAVLDCGSGALAFTTDSYVVRPIFFPGGDIGTLAINGTVNDLAMCGALPRYLSAGFILEEGFPIADLRRVVESMGRSAREAGIRVVTGDTKVVDRGKGDGIYINTAGIGIIRSKTLVAPSSVRHGDAILLSGDIGRHGIAIMAVREGLEFETSIESDCAPLASLVMRLIDAGIEVHCLRDLTRGGLASALVEIAETGRIHIAIQESKIPVRDDVRGACEILGFDPLYVANEGRFLAIVPEHDAEKAMVVMRGHPLGTGAERIGNVHPEPAGLVTMRSTIGAQRIVDMLSGEQLPRIC